MKSAISYYEKAYYLNMGYYGNKNINTEYFKVKLDISNNIIHSQVNLIFVNFALEFWANSCNIVIYG